MITSSSAAMLKFWIGVAAAGVRGADDRLDPPLDDFFFLFFASASLRRAAAASAWAWASRSSRSSDDESGEDITCSTVIGTEESDTAMSAGAGMALMSPPLEVELTVTGRADDDTIVMAPSDD